MNISWDADQYTRCFSFVSQYGSALLDWLEGEGLSVLDLGCGNGALTRALADRGHAAEGIDASGELLQAARARFPELRFFQGDAVTFRAERPYDAVFSNAVFHWIDRERQPQLAARVFAALKPGGQFVFEMGGQGNNARIHAALDRAFAARGLTYRMPFYFPSAGEYAALLERSGFQVRTLLLLDRPTALQGGDGLYDWMRMFLKTPLAGLEPALAESIFRAAVSELKDTLFRDGIWYADYVRLRCRAVRPL